MAMTSTLAEQTNAAELGRRRIQRVTTSGVAGLALAGFAMSYEALHALARGNGVSQGLAWIWPLIVDGFIIVASMSVVRAVIESRRTWHPWVLLLLFSIISVAGNVAQSPPTAVGRLVAAVPPIALVLAFDLLMRQVQLTLRPPEAAVPASSESGVKDDLEAPDLPHLRRLTAANKSVGGAGGRAAWFVARAHAAGQPVTGRWLAGQLSVSDGYARRLLRQINAAPGTPAMSPECLQAGTRCTGQLRVP